MPIPSSSTIIIRSGRSLEKLDGCANADQEDGDRNSVPHTSVASEKSLQTYRSARLPVTQFLVHDCLDDRHVHLGGRG